MNKDGDHMRDFENEQADTGRRAARVRSDQADAVQWQSASRAAAAGRVNGVEPGAVLRLQRMVGNAGVGALVEPDEPQRSPVLDVVGKGGGSPLPADVRAQMETGLGADFSDVRVHSDGVAAASAQAVQARAYTVGNEVVFNSGAYEPDTTAGQHTLAHELSHVVQQRSGPVDGTPTGDGIALSDPHDRFEQQAEAAATSFGRRTDPVTSAGSAPAAAGAVQRQGAEEEEVETQAMPLQREGAEEEELAE